MSADMKVNENPKKTKIKTKETDAIMIYER